MTPIEAAARRFIVAWDAGADVAIHADSDDCYDPAMEAKLDREVDESRDALRAALGIPDEIGTGDVAAHGGEGTVRIWLERKRQFREEGYDAAHDAGQGHALARAGVAYAIVGTGHLNDVDDDVEAWQWWPWSTEAWKPSRDLVHNLVRAGALIAAAIDAHLAAMPGDAIPDPGLMIEDAAETASDGGEL